MHLNLHITHNIVNEKISPTTGKICPDCYRNLQRQCDHHSARHISMPRLPDVTGALADPRNATAARSTASWDARTEMSDWRHRPFTHMMSRGGFA